MALASSVSIEKNLHALLFYSCKVMLTKYYMIL